MGTVSSGLSGGLLYPMPTYEYRCPDGHEFEQFVQKISLASSELPCPVCGKASERRISAGGGFVFKGSGFYITDYGKDGKKDQRDHADKAERAIAAKAEKADAAAKSDAPAAATAPGSAGAATNTTSAPGTASAPSSPAPSATSGEKAAPTRPAPAAPRADPPKKKGGKD